jgi:hypothetical protein
MASGQMLDDDRDWIDFAANVGKNRPQRRYAEEFGLRWIGGLGVVLAVLAGVWMAVRHF